MRGSLVFVLCVGSVGCEAFRSEETAVQPAAADGGSLADASSPASGCARLLDAPLTSSLTPFTKEADSDVELVDSAMQATVGLTQAGGVRGFASWQGDLGAVSTAARLELRYRVDLPSMPPGGAYAELGCELALTNGTTPEYGIRIGLVGQRIVGKASGERAAADGDPSTSVPYGGGSLDVVARITAQDQTWQQVTAEAVVGSAPPLVFPTASYGEKPAAVLVRCGVLFANSYVGPGEPFTVRVSRVTLDRCSAP